MGLVVNGTGTVNVGEVWERNFEGVEAGVKFWK